MTGFLEATASCPQKGKYRYAGNKGGRYQREGSLVLASSAFSTIQGNRKSRL